MNTDRLDRAARAGHQGELSRAGRTCRLEFRQGVPLVKMSVLSKSIIGCLFVAGSLANVSAQTPPAAETPPGPQPAAAATVETQAQPLIDEAQPAPTGEAEDAAKATEGDTAA